MKVGTAVEQYVELKRQGGFAFRTGQKALQTFSSRVGDLDLSHLTIYQVRSFLDESERLCEHWQVKYGILAHFFDHWTDRDIMPQLAMPTRTRKSRSTFVPYIFNRYQLRALLKAARSSHDCRRFIDIQTMRTLILLLYGTGAFTGEVLRLSHDDIDLDKHTIVFREKGARWREIPIGQSLTEVLRKYSAWRTREDRSGGTFLVTKEHQQIRTATAGNNFRKIRESAGIYRYDGVPYQPRLIDLKCTFAVHRISSWIRNGADLARMLPALAAYMGQTGLGSTEKYLALTPARFQKQLNKLSPQKRTFHWRNDPGLMTFLSSL